ncbi:NAD(P)-dependent oxidoreductase [Micromonospora echinofusca]|uniref:NAD(P)-dependent oxidoreductase n=1 Tax=Micromonospora echinofusca TaxID=47858 RepID=UPI001183B015|nr:NAD(P)-dependent oxidoreductase [Micromonospora sp. MSM11]MCL7458186.1 NAD(P)-binding domain-containing protein [Micromonospora sp. MSM11]
MSQGMNDLTSRRPVVLLTDDGLLSEFWAFLRERLEQRLSPTCDIRYLDVRESDLAAVDWADIDAVALFGGDLTQDMIAAATRLKVVASETDTCGIEAMDALWDAGIPFVEGTPGWGQSVAECGLSLILCGLRRIPQWHHEVITGFRPWDYPYVQFCDDPRFANGTVAGKTVGIIGVGEIGGRIASWCATLGATVLAYDPFRSPQRFAEVSAEPVDLDRLVRDSEILVVAAPDTPSVTGVVDRDHVFALRQGALVVTITRAAAIDAAALRERVLADELAWAADVYDVEPLPEGDPLIGRHNVVHLPHIAGRTRDANIAVADIVADDILRVLAGEQPRHPLTPQRLHVRLGRTPAARHGRDGTGG